MKWLIYIFISFAFILNLKAQEINIPFSTSENSLTIWNGEKYLPFFVKGINLGVAIPGTFPGELAASEEQYLNWFAQIKNAGFNCIRAYTLHYPRFYNALDAYNKENKHNPLLFFQGVWLNEEIPGYADDLYFLKDTFLVEIEENIDCVHGNKTIEARFGKAYGIYNSDVSQYCLGYIIGREVIPIEINTTNTNNSQSSFSGDHFSIQNGSASEVFVTESLNHVVGYENSNYATQRPVSFSSWPTLDPLEHPEEVNPEEDSEQLDLSKIIIESAPAGLFVSYHAYPYYPDFISEQESYSSFSDELGPNSYLGYLTDLKSHYTNLPLVIAEYGVPSSWTTAHYSSSGMNHGGFSEFEQGNANIRMLQNMQSLEIGGGIQFAWIDEWFKRTWITDKLDFNPEDRILWNNLAAAEQNFGLVKFDKPANQTSIADFGESDSIKGITAGANFSYLKIRIDLNQPLETLDELWIVLDTYDAATGESVLTSGDTIPDYRSEFSLHLTNYAAHLYVTQAYDLFGIWHGTSEPEQLFHSTSTDGAPWNLVRLKNNYLYPDVQFIGDLKIRNADQPIESNDAVIIYQDSIIIRLPWSYINFTAPNIMQVMHDDKGTNETETTTSDGVAIAVLYKDKWFNSSSRFLWDNWNATHLANLNESFKTSYWIMKDRLEEFNTPAVAFRDTFRFVHETYPLFVNVNDGLQKNDFDIDGNVLSCILMESPKHGFIDLDPEGSFYYSPLEDFEGYDTMTYSLYDGQSISEPVSVIFYIDQNITDIHDATLMLEKKVRISPNPCVDYLNVKSEDMINSYQIFNSMGQLISEEHVYSKDYRIILNELVSGSYIIIFKTKRGILSEKFIKQ